MAELHSDKTSPPPKGSPDPGSSKEWQMFLLHTSTCWQICISLAIWFSSSLLRLTRLVRFISRVCCHRRAWSQRETRKRGKKKKCSMSLRPNITWKSVSQSTNISKIHCTWAKHCSRCQLIMLYLCSRLSLLGKRWHSWLCECRNLMTLKQLYVFYNIF